MKHFDQYHDSTNDRLVLARYGSDGQHIRQGKRVAADCPLTREEIRIYVTSGTVEVVRFLRRTRKLSLREALDLLNLARNGTHDLRA